MTKLYDATKEHQPLARTANYNGKHPRSRVSRTFTDSNGNQQHLEGRTSRDHKLHGGKRGPNIRLMEVVGGSRANGYWFTRTRDGMRVS